MEELAKLAKARISQLHEEIKVGQELFDVQDKILKATAAQLGRLRGERDCLQDLLQGYAEKDHWEEIPF